MVTCAYNILILRGRVEEGRGFLRTSIKLVTTVLAHLRTRQPKQVQWGSEKQASTCLVIKGSAIDMPGTMVPGICIGDLYR